MSSGMSIEKAWRSRSCGVSCSAGGATLSWPAAVAPLPAPSRPSSSVLRKSAARGPSLMLTRLLAAISENLLRKLPVGVRRHAVRVVLQDGHALHRRFREPHRLADPRREDAVSKALLEQ